MKKILTSFILAAALTVTACSCENNNTSDTTTTTASAAESETTTEAPVTEAITTTTEAVTTVTETETTTETEIATGEDTDPVSAEIIGTGLIQSGRKGDGFLTYDRSLISEDIAASGMNEKALTKEAVLADFELYGNNTDNIYTFAMISKDGVQEYPSNDSTVFMSVLILNDVGYTISFGTGDKTTLEEVQPYCSAGKYIEYWAYATVSGGNQIVLIPFIAGSENSGYYLIKPVLHMLNADVSEMTLPEPVGDDCYETEPAETESYGTGTPETADGSAVLNITNIETYDGFNTASITMENKYNVPLYFTGRSILINGVDYSDEFVAFFNVDAGGTAEDYLYISGVNLAEGDNVEITFELENAESYEYFGEITFTMTLESTYLNA